MPPPLPRCSSWVYSSLISPSCVSLPRKGRRVGLHIDLFEACSAFTHVAACTLARSPIRDPLIEGFSHFVTSMTAPIASGWSESPGGTCTHWKAPPCHGAPPLRPLPSASREVSVGWEPAIRFRRIRMPQTRDTRRPCTCSRDSSVASGLSAGLIRSCGKVLAVYFPEGVGLLELMQRV